ncbi:MAG: hypothetical protein BGO09_02235 [Bacteroidetes bacterium 47-18]|nr:MAG: hypothetical protein BGO09_02235 [Bacteroidetes bacterium 47-18]
MAIVTRSNIGNLHDKLTVKLSKEDYFGAYEKALKNYSKNVNIPGFRKGMVPAGMVKKMYGNSIMMDEILRAANKEVDQYLQKEQPSIFAQPIAMPLETLNVDVNNPAEFEFDFEIGLKPDFEITPLQHKGSITRYNIIIDDKLIDLEVDNIQKRAGTIENPETLENDTDIVYASYELDGEQYEDAVSLDKAPSVLKEALKGQKAGFTQEIDLDALAAEELDEMAANVFKKDASSLKGKKAVFTLTKVGRLIPRELNESLFEEAFPGQGITTEEAFRDLLKQEIGKEGARLTNEKLQNEIFETLVHETKIELPVAFLKSWIKRSGEQIKTDEEVEKEYPSFEHQLIWTLISDKLIKEYDIKVSMDEVLADIKTKVLTYFGVNGSDEEPEWMAEYMDKMSKDTKTIDEAYRKLLFDKLFSKIAEVIEVKEEQVTGEEFGKIPNKYHQH